LSLLLGERGGPAHDKRTVEDKIKALQRHNPVLGKELATFFTQVEHLEKDRAEMINSQHQMKNETAAQEKVVGAQNRSREDSSNPDLAETNHRLRAAQHRIESLERENASLTKNFREKNPRSHRVSTNETMTGEEQSTTAGRVLDAAFNRKLDGDAGLADMDHQSSDALLRIQELEREKAGLEREKAELERTVGGLLREAEGSVREMEGLGRENEGLMRERAELLGELQTKNIHRNEPYGDAGLAETGRLSDALLQIQELARDRADLENEKAELERAVTGLARDVEGSVREVEGLVRDNEGLVKERARLMREKAELLEELETTKLQETKSEPHGGSGSGRSQIGTTNREEQPATDNRIPDSAPNRVHGGDAGLAEKDHRLSDALLRIQELERDKAELEGVRSKLERQVEASVREVEGLARDNEGLMRERATLMKENAELLEVND